MAKIVCDTSSLIKLKKGGILRLLDRIFDKILIPKAVSEECKDQELIQVIKGNNYEIHSVRNLLFESLGAGERESVSLAVEAKVKHILIDDIKGINKALMYNLSPIKFSVIATLAKEKGLISSVKTVLDQMIEKGEGIESEE